MATIIDRFHIWSNSENVYTWQFQLEIMFAVHTVIAELQLTL